MLKCVRFISGIGIKKQKELEKKYKDENNKEDKIIKELKEIIQRDEKLKNAYLDEIKIHLIFGFDGTNASKLSQKDFEGTKGQYAGAIGFSDARILLFPVKSVKGTFAWITCPYVLKRFKKDLEICEVKRTFEIPNENTIAKNSKIKVDDKVVILEEYSFDNVCEDDKTTKLAEFLAEETGIKEIKEKLIVVKDDVFKDFVTQFTEVITRTKINNSTGTVKDGALFTEEYLPAESVMYSLAMASPVFAPIEDKKGLENEEDVLNFFKECPNVIQIGANATIGKGICEIVINNENLKDDNEQK